MPYQTLMDISPESAVRANMLKSQILTGHVLDARILAALAGVARAEFAPSAFKSSAYVDEELPLGQGRFLMAPLDFARLLQHAAILAEETVLDIGCTTGYSTAVLSRLARKVVAVEEDAALAQIASKALSCCPNVALYHAPLVKGANADAPYDVILIEGAIECLPQALADQLREGGRLLTAEHNAAAKVGAVGLSTLIEYRKMRGKLYKTLLRDTSTALLSAFRKPPVFAL